MAGEALHNVSLYNSLWAQIEAKSVAKFNHSLVNRLKTYFCERKCAVCGVLFISLHA